MPVHKGSEGIVRVAGTSTVGEVRSFSVESTADTLETTTMGVTARTYLPSLTSWSGSVDVLWDETDAGQTALTIGTELQVSFYPEGNVSTDTYYTGTAIVTGISVNSSYDGLVESSVSIQGDGALTITTV